MRRIEDAGMDVAQKRQSRLSEGRPLRQLEAADQLGRRRAHRPVIMKHVPRVQRLVTKERRAEKGGAAQKEWKAHGCFGESAFEHAAFAQGTFLSSGDFCRLEQEERGPKRRAVECIPFPSGGTETDRRRKRTAAPATLLVAKATIPEGVRHLCSAGRYKCRTP